MNPNKNSELLTSFTAYCQEHPEQRFWQALRNWAGAGSIFVMNEEASYAKPKLTDTFYFEGRTK